MIIALRRAWRTEHQSFLLSALIVSHWKLPTLDSVWLSGHVLLKDYNPMAAFELSTEISFVGKQFVLKCR